MARILSCKKTIGEGPLRFEGHALEACEPGVLCGACWMTGALAVARIKIDGAGYCRSCGNRWFELAVKEVRRG